MFSKYVTRAGFGGSGVDTGIIDANAEVLVVDVQDLDRITCHAIQVTDSGTVTLVIEGTMDGTAWLLIGASMAETNFPAGAQTVIERTISDANAMSLVYKQVRLRCTAYGASGVYRFQVSGVQRDGNR
jgi:hypothetical protein